MTSFRELNEESFSRLAAEMPSPIPPNELRVRVGAARRRRRWTAGVGAVVGAACLVGAVLAVVQLRSPAATRVIYSADPGSAGMPATFVAADPSGNVYLLDSSTGKVLRQLYRHAGQVGFSSLTADSQDVFVSDEHGIHRIRRAGGPGEIISSQTATAMAVSPDGTSLAWATANPVAGPSDSRPTITVTVKDLQDRTDRHWTLIPPVASLGPPASATPRYDTAYNIFQLGWTGPQQVAAVISSELASGGRAAADPALVTFDTRTGAMSPQLDIPSPDAGWLVAGAHYLGPGSAPGRVVTTMSPGPGSPSRLVELTVRGNTVTVRTLLQLPAVQGLPQSVDPDGHDLLLSAPSGGAWTFLRSTDLRPPTSIATGARWSAYASW